MKGPIFCTSLLIATVAWPIFASERLVILSDIGWYRITETNSYDVAISNGVDDQCWTGEAPTKTAVELEIKRSNLPVKSDALIPVLISLNSIGYALNSSSCVVTHELTVSIPDIEERNQEGYKLSSIQYRQLWKDNGVMSGAKADINFRLKEQYVQSIQSFLNEIDVRQNSVLAEIQSSEQASDTVKSFWKVALTSQW